MIDNLKIEVGHRISKCRNDQRLTLEEAGVKVGATAQQLSNWERGIRPVSLEYLHKLSAFFDVSFAWLGAADDKALRPKSSTIIVSDNLMMPDLKKGNEVEVDTSIKAPDSTDMFAIEVNNQTIVRWIVQEINGEYTVSAGDSKLWGDVKYADIHALHALKILGRVHSIKNYT